MDPKTTAVIEEEQRLAIEKNYPMFSRPMNHDDFLTALNGTEAAETTGRGYTS